VNIYLPLSVPVLATLALFYAVGRWNGFSDALLYLTESQWHPIQLKLYNIINNISSIEIATMEGLGNGGVPPASDGMKAAAVMFATVPILIVYPWLQRYFIAGVSLGAVKE
jgi:putative aldouronate transport system permease protein